MKLNFVNLSIRRRFVGIIFTDDDDVIIDEEFVEL